MDTAISRPTTSSTPPSEATAPGIAAPAATAGPPGSRTRRIAANALIQAGGEAGSKVATVVLYAIMARELGAAAFGDFTSACSLALFVMVAALGTDFTVTRLVAGADARSGEALWHAIVLKVALGMVGVLLVMAVAILGAYDDRVVTATAVLAAAMVLDLVTLSLQAVFRGHEHTVPIAKGQLMQRGGTALFGIVVLVAGGSLLDVCVVWLAASVFALLYALTRLRHMPTRPVRERSLAGMRSVLTDSLGLGLSGAFGAALSRLDIVILGLIKSSSAVAAYGGAYRLFESTFFITTTFALATFPTLSRLTATTQPTIAWAYGRAMKVVVVVTTPLAVGSVLYAAPVMKVVYGAGFGDAAVALRLLAPGIVLFGVMQLSSFVMASQRRQREVAVALAFGVVANATINLTLIPGHSFRGAALAMSISMVVTDAVLVVLAGRSVGRLPGLRICLGPGLAAAAMAGVGLGLHSATGGLPLAVLAYGAVLALVERLAFPDDLRNARSGLRRRVHPDAVPG